MDDPEGEDAFERFESEQDRDSWGMRKEEEGEKSESAEGTRSKVDSKQNREEGLGVSRRATGRSALDEPEGEDPFERLDRELSQGPWDAWVVDCDGIGGEWKRVLPTIKLPWDQGPKP